MYRGDQCVLWLPVAIVGLRMFTRDERTEIHNMKVVSGTDVIGRT